MTKIPLALFAAAVLCFVAPRSYATGGCVNSPENPTAILAAVGSAGAVFFSRRKR